MNDLNIHKIHKVKSQSDPKVIYDVTMFEDGFMSCDCIYFQMRGFRGKGCKHTKFIQNKYYKKNERS